MRKQDRIRQQQNPNQSDQPSQAQQPHPGEQVKGSASTDQPKPPRQPGEKLPLPD